MVYLPPPSPDHEWDSEEEEEDGIADQEPLDINWAQVNAFNVAVCSLPGNRLCKNRRSLVADLETLKNQGFQDIFVLCTEQELQWSKVNTLLIDYAMNGFTTHHYPISDEQPPSMLSCTDGLGRSCMILVLLDMVLNPDLPALLALEHIRQVRGPGAVKTVKQYNFIMEFHKNWADFRQQQENGGALVVST